MLKNNNGYRRVQMLTVNQEKFCIEFMKSDNASDAYRKSYPCKNMSDKTINEAASRLKCSSKVLARIDELRQPVIDKLQVTEEKTLRRLMQGQEFDIRRLYHDDGRLRLPHELDDDTAKAIVGVKYDREGALLEYKIIDVKGCADSLGKHLKLFTDKHEHTGKDGAALFPIPPLEKRPTDPAELARLYLEIVSS